MIFPLITFVREILMSGIEVYQILTFCNSYINVLTMTVATFQ